MSLQLTSSTTFASLVNELHKSPDDPLLKHRIMGYLQQMKKLAEHDALALYHLAFVFAPNTPQQRKYLLRSADLGCTNAMVAACKMLVQSKTPGDLPKAILYLKKIEQSSDTYIKEQAQELIRKYPELTPTQQEKLSIGAHAYGFFATAQDGTEISNEPQENHQPQV